MEYLCQKNWSEDERKSLIANCIELEDAFRLLSLSVDWQELAPARRWSSPEKRKVLYSIPVSDEVWCELLSDPEEVLFADFNRKRFQVYQERYPNFCTPERMLKICARFSFLSADEDEAFSLLQSICTFTYTSCSSACLTLFFSNGKYKAGCDKNLATLFADWYQNKRSNYVYLTLAGKLELCQAFEPHCSKDELEQLKSCRAW